MVHFLFLTLPMCAFCINLVFNICMWLDGKSGKVRDVAVPRLKFCVSTTDGGENMSLKNMRFFVFLSKEAKRSPAKIWKRGKSCIYSC